VVLTGSGMANAQTFAASALEGKSASMHEVERLER